MKKPPTSARARALKWVLIAVVLSAAATAVAFSLNPLDWIGGEVQKPGSAVLAQARAPAQVVESPAALPAGAAANQRAIVRQAGPAVVRVTVGRPVAPVYW